MTVLGRLVVQIAAEMSRYKADMDAAAQTTVDAAAKIEKSTDAASTATQGMGQSMQDNVQTARALAGSAGAAGGILAGLALAAGAAGYAAYKGSQEQEEYKKALILTGNAAGTTASQMQAMASGIDRVVGTQSQAASALAQLAATSQVAGANLQAFAQVALQMQRTVGTSVGETVNVFAELGREPVKASLKLNESMNYLTASTFAQIKAAQDLGNESAAASIAQRAYANAQTANMAQIEASMGTLERAWLSLRGSAKEAWDAMLGLGRSAGVVQEMQAAKDTVANLEALLARGGTATPDIQRKLDAAKVTLAMLQESARLDAKSASWQADQVQAEKDKIKWMQDGEKYRTSAEKLESSILRIRREGQRAGADELEIERRIQIEREKAAPKSKAEKSAPIDDAARSLAGYVSGLERELETTEKITAEAKAQNFLKTLGKTGEIAQVRELVLGLAEQVDREKELTQVLAQKRAASIAAGDEVNKQNEAYQQNLKRMLDATPTAILEKQREDVALLTAEFEAGRLSEELYLEAVSKRLDLTNTKINDTDRLARSLGLTFSSAFEDAIVSGKELSKVVQGLGQDIARIVVRRTMTEPLGNAVSDWAKSAMPKSFSFGGASDFGSGSAFGNMDLGLNFEGGGDTGNGPRSGGLDGKGGFLAMVHPQETVIDRTKGQSTQGAGSVTLSQTFYIDSRSDQASIIAIVRQMGEQTKADIFNDRRRGGMFA
jgi:phage-related minor tail protein